MMTNNTSPKKILIAGAGQLGSRYLQGLAKYSHPLEVFIFDLHQSSLDMTLSRWKEVCPNKSAHHLTFMTDLQKLPLQLDLAIIATTASTRPQLVTDISQKSKVQFWILEKVLAQSDLGLSMLQKAIRSESKAWVNTPRRALPWHAQIKKQLRQGQPLEMSITGHSWGLACNSVHFLDLLSWYSDESLQTVTTAGLDTEWFEGKRKDNFEIYGAINAVFSAGSKANFLVTASAQGEVDYKIILKSGPDTWEIDEINGTATRSDGLSIPGRIPYQSEMTLDLLNEIFSTGTCGLPILEESAQLHRVFLQSLIQHWQKTHPKAQHVPIT